MSDTPVVFAVTTRSRLKGLRYFPLMFVASMQVKRQLARTPGVIRWASVIAGPTEFWTFTVWSSRDRMIEFMGSGAHESIMWLFGKWLRSFWLTRWRPTVQEEGQWNGLSMAPHRDIASWERRTAEQQAALDAALAAFPRLRDSVDEDGAATLATAGFTRRRERRVAGIGGVMVRVVIDHPRDLVRLWRLVRGLQRSLDECPDVLRRAVGWASSHEALAMIVFQDLPGEAMPVSVREIVNQAQLEWGTSLWWMRWDAANEFGQWDGFRVRQSRQLPQSEIDRPPGTEAAASG